jgi:hypothetical protein
MIMRRTFFGLLIMLNVIVGCSSRHGEHQEEATDAEADEWTAMDSFHMIMAETFHPYKDSSNLQPIKDHAEELKAEAIKWADAPLPSRVDNEKVKQDLISLKTDATALAELVKTGTDQEIAASLIELHDRFHKLQEAWYAKGETHAHDHH